MPQIQVLHSVPTHYTNAAAPFRAAYFESLAEAVNFEIPPAFRLPLRPCPYYKARSGSIHAGAKSKAYSISKTEPVDLAAEAIYIPLVRAAQRAVGGRSLHTAGGKVVPLGGGSSQECGHHRGRQPAPRFMSELS
jgi:hypothetical protein